MQVPRFTHERTRIQTVSTTRWQWPLQTICIYLVNKHVLGTCYVPITTLGAKDTAENKEDSVLDFKVLTFYRGKTINKPDKFRIL